jgi:hypothetical protein
MFRLIFMAQAIVYLLLMPVIHGFMDPFYSPPLFVSIIAIGCLVAGFGLLKILHPVSRFDPEMHPSAGISELMPRGIAPFLIGILTLLYAFVSLSNGLWNRRQGSEFMADVYGNLPLVELAILRIYEIVFIPAAVIYLFGKQSSASRFTMMLILLASLPFMGIQDSRGRILVLSVSILSFVRIDSVRSFIVNNLKVLILVFLAVGVFIYVSVQRATSYARAEDYFFYEVVRRFDGLNLVSQLRDSGYINYFGSFDLAMFGPLVSRIPFIEAGRFAKLEGVTSTKQYFLKSILNTGKIDDSNSMILDPLYFGGLVSVAIAFAALGYFIAKFDRYVGEGRLFSSRTRLSLFLAFVTSFAIIEVDYFGTVTSFIQNFVILFPLLLVMLRRPQNSSNSFEPSAVVYDRRTNDQGVTWNVPAL